MENILNFFYEKASVRIEKKVKDSGLKHKDIYPNDPKQISWIINNQRTKNNRFLITGAVLGVENDPLNQGLVNKLDFKNVKEILWGTDEEITSYLPDLFKLLWQALPNNDPKYQLDKDLILCDYVSYAENSTYCKLLLTPKYYGWPFRALYGKSEDIILGEQEKIEEEAIDFLYLKCAKKFEEIFDDFTNRTTSFKKLNKTIQNEFFDTAFVNLIKQNKPKEHSLGVRAKAIIESDLSQSANLIIEYNETGHINELKKKLINAASTYVLRLKDIQMEAIKNADLD